MLLLLQIVLLIRKYIRWPYHMEYIDLFRLFPEHPAICFLSHRFHVFCLHASLVLPNPCHPCHLWALLSPIILVPRIPRISSLGILCPTYLCHPCHLWALLPPIILVPRIYRFPRISSLGILRPTYLCNLWALLFRQVMSLKISLIR